MTPDLSFNLIHTLYSLFAHNYIVFAYLTGLLLSIYISIRHPSRFASLLVVGFALLTFSFEYDKHIVDGLRQQTIQSLITTRPHYTVQKWVNIIISDILPVFFYGFGWTMLFWAIFLGSKNSKK